MMNAFLAVFMRELRAYFLSPLAYVFLSVYLLATGLATWNLARFFDTAIASLSPFFQFQPWLFAVFIPAIGMRLWSEDLRSRTSDLYFTSLRPLWLIHAAKLCAGLAVIGLALLATLPYWISVNYLGRPDNAVIFASYLSLVGLGVIFLLVTLVFSALTQQQVIAFVLSTATCFGLLTFGLGNVTGQLSGFLPGWLVSGLQGLSVLDGYFRALRGSLLMSDILFGTLFAAFLFALGTAILRAHRQQGQKKPVHWDAIAFIIFLLAIPVARFNSDRLLSGWRMDVTADRLNTLSPAAGQLVRDLHEPITLTYYYNEAVGRDYPEIRTHAERVRALLDAYVSASAGRLNLNIVDPVPFSAAEDLAITQGIEAIPTEGLDPLYFGLTAENLVDDVNIISFLNPEQDSALEFDIATLIARLDQPDLPRIGILSGIPGLGPEKTDGSMRHILNALEVSFQIDWLSPETRDIPDTIDTLMVIAPDRLSDYAAYQIDQYLLRKGRVIVITDPSPLLTGAESTPEPLINLLSAWGITPSENTLADDQIGLTINVYGPGGTQRPERQPLYPGPGQANMARDDFLVSTLQRPVHFGGAGWFDVEDRQGLTATSLIFSSENTAQLEPKDVNPDELTPSRVRTLARPLEGPVPLALRLSGRFQTAYPGGAPDSSLPDDPILRQIAQAELSDRKHLARSTLQGELVLIADTDFLTDSFYVHPQSRTPIADNEALVLSILDQFAGRSELAALRTRPQARRPMTRIIELREAAEAEYLAEQDKVEAEILAIESQISGNLSAATQEQREAYLSSREKLRGLQRAFRSRINALETILRSLTIWLPMTLAILAGLGIHLLGRRRR